MWSTLRRSARRCFRRGFLWLRWYAHRPTRAASAVVPSWPPANRGPAATSARAPRRTPRRTSPRSGGRAGGARNRIRWALRPACRRACQGADRLARCSAKAHHRHRHQGPGSRLVSQAVDNRDGRAVTVAHPAGRPPGDRRTRIPVAPSACGGLVRTGERISWCQEGARRRSGLRAMSA
jgi:hypothetical protein